MTTIADQTGADVGMEWTGESPPTTTPERGQRDAYTAGLRAIADAIDNNPDIRTPTIGAGTQLMFARSREEFLALAALFNDDAQPRIDTSGRLHHAFELVGRIHGLQVTLCTQPEYACEKLASRLVEHTDWAYNGVRLGEAAS